MNTAMLEQAGLSAKEAALYLTLLHSGKLTVAALAQKSGVKRPTVYPLLAALGEKGFVKQAVIGKRRYYLPESPRYIAVQLEKKQQKFATALPDLEEIFKKSAHEPETTTYYGKESLKRLYMTIQNEALWAKTIFSPASFIRVFSLSESRMFAAGFSDREATLLSLLPNDATSKRLVADNKRSGFKQTNKLLPKDYILSVNSIVWGDRVALISYENLFAIELHNAEIARYFENQFDWWWKTLK